ncbi:MAG: hypothetical protein KGL18_06285 [Burkholderiales bacterium]|nr:hypothetical protein [Burkholderiales bacterium]MDE1925736.1 hypothetical protein [Burkholderiales bacterium]MDE2157984.1 hypothetical protein [Burkholderiales bacterium]MDE2502572.1 hypothetical protein [Burkholderiales bacterium]
MARAVLDLRHHIESRIPSGACMGVAGSKVATADFPKLKSLFACLPLLSLTGCAVPSTQEDAARFSDTDVNGFLRAAITFGKMDSGKPLFEAWFKPGQSSDLYVPSARLKIFCEAKGGSWVRPSDSEGPRGLEISTQLMLSLQRKAMGPEFSASVQKAAQAGAFGVFGCNKNDRLLWTVRIEQGRYRVDTSMGTTGILQLLLSTRIGA